MCSTLWVHSATPDAVCKMNQNLRYLLDNVNPAHRPLAFACIGSANVCGDHLGPLIGSILSRCHLPHVYGTMLAPLNALTLPRYLPLLHALTNRCCLISIDAAIGTPAQTGYITLSEGPLCPGSAHRQNLPPIGDLQITGVFNQLTDNNSRQLVPTYCRLISKAILNCSNYGY